MNKEAMRFLALNSILHGHSVLEGFQNSVETMASCLGVDVEIASRLANDLDSLPEVEVSENPMVKLFLNFYRNNAYTFVAMGTDIVPLCKFMVNDLNGQVSSELRISYLGYLIRDAAQDEMYVDPFICDGVLHCTPQDFQYVQQAMLNAYALYLGGPVGTTKSLAKSLRRYTSLDDYSRLNEATALRIFKQIVKEGKKATIYQRTLLNTPDLVETYTHTGCIIAFSDPTRKSVNWLMGVESELDNTMVMTVEMSTLQNYLLRSVRDLENVKVARGPGGNGKIMFPGVT